MRACGPRHTLSCTMMGQKDGPARCMSMHCDDCGKEVSLAGCRCKQRKLIFAKRSTVGKLRLELLDVSLARAFREASPARAQRRLQIRTPRGIFLLEKVDRSP